jgi:hypothetical protein
LRGRDLEGGSRLFRQIDLLMRPFDQIIAEFDIALDRVMAFVFHNDHFCPGFKQSAYRGERASKLIIPPDHENVWKYIEDTFVKDFLQASSACLRHCNLSHRWADFLCL